MATCEMIPHTKAAEMARAYQEQTAIIRESLKAAGEALQKLNDTFDGGAAGFDIQMETEGHHRQEIRDPRTMESLMRDIKRKAWRHLVRKLDIEKLMSSKAQDEMREAFYNRRHQSNKLVDEMPDITEESIHGVLSGFIQSADEIFTEKIAEVYRMLVPRTEWRGEFKTNKTDRVGRKVILSGYLNGMNYDNSGWNIAWGYREKLMALDTVFHVLAGRGIPKNHDGDLAAAVLTCGETGCGETEFFRFKGFKKGTLHIEILDDDLRGELNRKMGEANLGGR